LCCRYGPDAQNAPSPLGAEIQVKQMLACYGGLDGYNCSHLMCKQKIALQGKSHGLVHQSTFPNEFEVRPTVLASESVHLICEIWAGAVG